MSDITVDRHNIISFIRGKLNEIWSEYYPIIDKTEWLMNQDKKINDLDIHDELNLLTFECGDLMAYVSFSFSLPLSEVKELMIESIKYEINSSKLNDLMDI